MVDTEEEGEDKFVIITTAGCDMTSSISDAKKSSCVSSGCKYSLLVTVLCLARSYWEILGQWSKYLAPGGTIVIDINHPLRIVGAITFAKPFQVAEKRRTVEAKAI